MQTFMQRVFLAAICLCVVGSTVGCSLIGYAVGGAIDPTKYALDSVSVTKQVDSVGVEHRSWKMERLTSLARKARPGEGFAVEVMTRDQLFKEDGFTIDTAFTLKSDSIYRWTEGLHRGDLVLPNPSERPIHVLGLFLGQESPPLFIPLREVQWIGVRRPAEDKPWGTGRIIGVAVGGAVDIAAIIAFIAHAIPFPKFFGNRDRDRFL